MTCKTETWHVFSNSRKAVEFNVLEEEKFEDQVTCLPAGLFKKTPVGSFLKVNRFDKSTGKTAQVCVNSFEKPVAQMELLLHLCTTPGDVVVELCGGTAAMGVACLKAQEGYEVYRPRNSYVYVDKGT